MPVLLVCNANVSSEKLHSTTVCKLRNKERLFANNLEKVKIVINFFFLFLSTCSFLCAIIAAVGFNLSMFINI